MARAPRFRRYAWAFFAYLLLVILFGAWVRITHAGAGCGSHWPTCHGQIIPLDPSIETMIEYTHRLTSGLLGILGLVLVGWAARSFGRHRVTWSAVVTLVFIVLEAMIGAGLVLKELVASDDSVARAIVISLHLVNTLMLTGAASLTAWWSTDERPVSPRALGTGTWILAAGLLALVATCMTGAVTALGDTLFPVQATSDAGLLERLSGDLSPAKHFLVRLRIIHPVVAVVAAGIVYGVGAWIREHAKDDRSPRLGRALQHAVLTQVVLGLLDIGLAAPGWMQLLHLLLAQGVWVAAVLTTVSAWAGAASAATGRPA
ncbi:COX15/CtaA family protein [Paraliomyxa miuraensis]|uniref:COX15/CtaA family protein n=1 Tax=Paraliomyxa miuraensis TaxID=376150 RepID=UPI00225972C5|nr:COX15/CtaA family protein [Paraliomyxa miuraensis]MCX4248092.1 COX15/CtaA family protein [Paraliomyxa miuraensis]